MAAVNCGSVSIGGNGQSSSSAAVDGTGFSSQSLLLRLQKKVFGKMAGKGFAKHFTSETNGRILDNTYLILKDYYSKKEAEKVVKNIMKLGLKMSVLASNNRLSSSDSQHLMHFQKKFQNLAKTMVSFHEVDFTYDRQFLLRSLDEAVYHLRLVTDEHLSDKSSKRVSMVVTYLGKPELVDTLFSSHSPFKEQFSQIIVDLNLLIERGEL